MSVALRGNCPYCSSPYGAERGKCTVVATKNASGVSVLTKDCCEQCVSSVCEVVKEWFSPVSLAPRPSLENRVEVDPKLFLHLQFLNFGFCSALNRYRDFSDFQLLTLFTYPDYSSREVYSSVVEEIITRKDSLIIEPSTWAFVLDRVLPVPADGDPSRVVINNAGMREARFHGDIESFRLLSNAICKYQPRLPESIWGEALLRVGPHCIRITFNENVCSQKEYSEGDPQMMAILLSAIREIKASLSFKDVIASLALTKDTMHTDVLKTFFVVSPNQQIVDFFIQSANDVRADLYLVFFEKCFVQLLEIKTEEDLHVIIPSIFSSYKGGAYETQAILDIMLKRSVQHSS